ncbi:MAG TPA: hypothetical protein VH482_05265 [Thermomicrobiales bacterium]
MDVDLAIRGGAIVTASGQAAADIGIRDGRIAQLGGGLAAAETGDTAPSGCKRVRKPLTQCFLHASLHTILSTLSRAGRRLGSRIAGTTFSE